MIESIINKYKFLSRNIINSRHDKWSISSTVTEKKEQIVIVRQIEPSQIESGFAIIMNIDSYSVLPSNICLGINSDF